MSRTLRPNFCEFEFLQALIFFLAQGSPPQARDPAHPGAPGVGHFFNSPS